MKYNKMNLEQEEREEYVQKVMDFYKWNERLTRSLTDIQLQEMLNHADKLESEGRTI